MEIHSNKPLKHFRSFKKNSNFTTLSLIPPNTRAKHHVPSNHDLNWEQAENTYRIERGKNYKGELREGCYIDQSDIIEIRDEQDYKQRFANFSNFYPAIGSVDFYRITL